MAGSRSSRGIVVGLVALVVGLVGLPLQPAPGASATAKFKLSTSPTTATVGRGSATVITLRISRIAPFAGPVTIGATSARAGVGVVLVTNPVSADSANLTVVARPTAAIGTTVVSVIGRTSGFTFTLKLRVRIVSKLPTYAVTTPLDPLLTATGISVPTTAGSTSASNATSLPAVTTTTTNSSTLPATSLGSATSAPTSATPPTSLTSTSTTSSTSTTIPVTAAAKGYVLFKRVVSQAQRCDLNSPVTPNVKVAMQLTNTDSVTRTISVVKPNTCQEQLLGTVSPGALVALLVPPESLVVVRASSGGNPIQRVFRFDSSSATINVSGVARFLFSCTNPLIGGTLSMTDGQVVVYSRAAGSQCQMSESMGNAGSLVNPTFTVVGLANTCIIPTLETPVPSGTTCYSEVLATN